MLNKLKSVIHPKRNHTLPQAEAFPLFGRLFMSSANPLGSLNKQENLASIKQLQQKVQALQNDYQPAYGLQEEYPSARQELLERNCELITQEVQVKGAEQQIRILDVGCNCGYTAMKLAETFPNVVGLEIQQDLTELANRLAAHTGSSARFYDVDIFALLLEDKCDFENIDVLLLLNVMHQIIFHYGLDQAKAMLFNILAQVDYVFVELAHQKDYIRHGKDHLLPSRPEYLLDGLEELGFTIKKLADSPRPFYLIKRSQCTLGNLHIQYHKLDYSRSKNPLISRKYYAGQHQFLKLFRFTYGQSNECYERELKALLATQHLAATPRLHNWTMGHGYGAIVMSCLPGQPLTGRVYGKNKPSQTERFHISAQYVALNRLLQESIGFHNDLQPHNLFIDQHNALFVFDFEQAHALPQNDPYGIFLWTLFDIWGGRVLNRPQCIASLRPVPQGKERAVGAIYPDFSTLDLPEQIKKMVTEALTAPDWATFIGKWDDKLASAIKPS